MSNRELKCCGEFQYRTNYCALQCVRCLTVLLSRRKGCHFLDVSSLANLRKLIYYGSPAVEYSEFKHSRDKNRAIWRTTCMRTSCQEQAEGLPAISSELSYCTTVLIICAFGTNGTLRGYFATSLGKRFAHKTHRGHKRSSGRKRYPSPIQAFVTISCCASSKGRLLKNDILRELPLRVCYLV